MSHLLRAQNKPSVVSQETLGRWSNEKFVSAWCDEAVNEAFVTRQAVIKKRMKGETAGFSFRSLKDIRQRFYVQKLAAGFVAKQFSVAEKLPGKAFGKLTK
jgi:hypothetical protein